MSLLTLLAGKGTPGVTTSALALAAVWPRHCVLVEADPAGGDLPYRLRRADGNPLALDRGVVSLATAARAAADPRILDQHTQDLAGGLPVLIGPTSSLQASGLEASWPRLAALLSGTDDVDVLADVGRLSASTPTPLLTVADLVVLTCRADVASVAHTRAALRQLNRTHSLTPVVMVIGGSRAVAQVREALRPLGEVDVVGPLADDPPAAAGLAGRWTRRLDRSGLVTSARAVARILDTRLAERAPSPPPLSVALPGAPDVTAARVAAS
jgi:hypothetical protein